MLQYEGIAGESVLTESAPRRKLSFSQDTETEAEAEVKGASPEMPGEMFTLDNITEEPDTRDPGNARLYIDTVILTSLVS